VQKRDSLRINLNPVRSDSKCREGENTPLISGQHNMTWRWSGDFPTTKRFFGRNKSGAARKPRPPAQRSIVFTHGHFFATLGPREGLNGRGWGMGGHGQLPCREKGRRNQAVGSRVTAKAGMEFLNFKGGVSVFRLSDRTAGGPFPPPPKFFLKAEKSGFGFRLGPLKKATGGSAKLRATRV